MTAWIDFECYRKRGKGWQYLGTYEGEDSHKAARKAAHIHNLKVVGARPSDTNVKLFVYRFENVPHLTGC